MSKHNDKAPTCTISMNKIDTAGDAKRSIPLVETVNIGSVPIGIQFDTGCQMSLISKSVLQQLPEEIYSVGRSVRLRVLTYAGEGQVISTTSVKLNLNGFQLKLLSINADLNNRLAFSFPTPGKWRACTENSTTSHSGRVSILLGNDNPLAFPKKEERDDGGAVLWKAISPINLLSTKPSTLNSSPGLTLSISSALTQFASNPSPCKSSKSSCS